MGRITGIEWTDSTWNPIRGCSRVSEGCRNCYAEKVAARFSGEGLPYEGLAQIKNVIRPNGETETESRWTGEVRFIEKHLEDPLRWKAPRKIFVNSMSDLFHPKVTAEMLAAIFDVMARAPQHTYQILTKRPERMLESLEAGNDIVVRESFEKTYGQEWPPRNWWFGVSVEDQKTANERIPILALCNAYVRFISYEPALGPVNWFEALPRQLQRSRIHWIIAGGESGLQARPMHPDWARAAREFCNDHQIPFFFKQWGEWGFGSARPGQEGKWAIVPPDRHHVETERFPRAFDSFGSAVMQRIGKNKSGSSLDGVEWKELPECG